MLVEMLANKQYFLHISQLTVHAGVDEIHTAGQVRRVKRQRMIPRAQPAVRQRCNLLPEDVERLNCHIRSLRNRQRQRRRWIERIWISRLDLEGRREINRRCFLRDCKSVSAYPLRRIEFVPDARNIARLGEREKVGRSRNEARRFGQLAAGHPSPDTGITETRSCFRRVVTAVRGYISRRDKQLVPNASKSRQ